MAKGKGGSTSPATAARRHHTSIWGKPGPSCDTPQCTPGLFLCPAAMLHGAGSLELGRDISMSTSVPVTADSSVMTPLETIMTDNCLMRSGLFRKKNNSIDEARGHFGFESLLFQPSPSWWLTALTALPWPPGSGPLTQQALFDGTPKSKHRNQAGILLSTSAGRKPTARLQDFFGHCWWVLQVFMAPCLHLPPALHIFFLV